MSMGTAVGKLLLVGDHALVYGSRGVAVPWRQKVQVVAALGQDGVNAADEEVAEFVAEVAAWWIDQAGMESQQVAMDVHLELPIKSGAGSSTALVVATIRALAALFAVTVSPTELIDWAVEFESRSYPVSGADQVAVVLDQPLIVETRPRLSWRPLASEVPELEQLMVIQSGPAIERTAEMVGLVKKRLAQQPELQRVIDRMTQVADDCIANLEAGRWSPSLITQYGQDMIKLGVVGRRAQGMLEQLWSLGAAAKVTAAGGVAQGSGLLLAWHQDQSVIESLAREQGWEIWSASLERKVAS